MESVRAEFFLLIGSKLVHESKAASLIREDSGEPGFIDGALFLSCGDTVVLDERYWDRLDESLLALLSGVGHEQTGRRTVQFPDTLLEIEVEEHEGSLSLSVEHRSFSLPADATRKALKDCARRLVQITAELKPLPPAIKELRATLGEAG